MNHRRLEDRLTWMERLAILAVGIALSVLFAVLARAQMVADQPCGSSLACMSQRVKDLQDYRAFLEDQLALAKSLNAGLEKKLVDLEAKLARCQPVPELPPRQEKEVPK